MLSLFRKREGTNTVERKIEIEQEFYVKLSGKVTTDLSNEEITRILCNLDEVLKK